MRQLFIFLFVVSAIGDATSAMLAFFDYGKKMFKVIPIDQPSEVASLTGDLALEE